MEADSVGAGEGEAAKSTAPDHASGPATGSTSNAQDQSSGSTDRMDVEIASISSTGAAANSGFADVPDEHQDSDGMSEADESEGADEGTDSAAGSERGDPPDAKEMDSEEVIQWMARWRAHLLERGQPVLRQAPVISGKPLDIYALYHEFKRRGGLEQLLANRELSRAVLALGYPHNYQFQNTSQRLKRFYQQNLLSLEAWELRGEKSQYRGPMPSHGNALSEPAFPGAIQAAQRGRKPKGSKHSSRGVGSAGEDDGGGGAADQRVAERLPDWSAVTKNETEAWMRAWKEEMQRRGLKCKVPLFGGLRLDVHRLFVTVQAYGGFDAVCRRRKWREVQRQMGLEDVVGVTLKQHYHKLLRTYEAVLAGDAAPDQPPGGTDAPEQDGEAAAPAGAARGAGRPAVVDPVVIPAGTGPGPDEMRALIETFEATEERDQVRRRIDEVEWHADRLLAIVHSMPKMQGKLPPLDELLRGVGPEALPGLFFDDNESVGTGGAQAGAESGEKVGGAQAGAASGEAMGGAQAGAASGKAVGEVAGASAQGGAGAAAAHSDGGAGVGGGKTVGVGGSSSCEPPLGAGSSKAEPENTANGGARGNDSETREDSGKFKDWLARMKEETKKLSIRHGDLVSDMCDVRFALDDQTWKLQPHAEPRKKEERPFVPLYPAGPHLFCKGEFVSINSETSDIPFVAQLLDYNRDDSRLTVRWIYRCEEVESKGQRQLNRYRKRYCPPQDVSETHPRFNRDRELFFSFHVDRDVHTDSVLGLVMVFFLDGNPIRPHRHIRRNEYYCRSGWDPAERQVFGFFERDIRAEHRHVIEEELSFSPYPHPATTPIDRGVSSEPAAPTRRGRASAGGSSGAGSGSREPVPDWVVPERWWARVPQDARAAVARRDALRSTAGRGRYSRKRFADSHGRGAAPAASSTVPARARARAMPSQGPAPRPGEMQRQSAGFSGDVGAGFAEREPRRKARKGPGWVRLPNLFVHTPAGSTPGGASGAFNGSTGAPGVVGNGLVGKGQWFEGTGEVLVDGFDEIPRSPRQFGSCGSSGGGQRGDWRALDPEWDGPTMEGDFNGWFAHVAELWREQIARRAEEAEEEVVVGAPVRAAPETRAHVRRLRRLRRMVQSALAGCKEGGGDDVVAPPRGMMPVLELVEMREDGPVVDVVFEAPDGTRLRNLGQVQEWARENREQHSVVLRDFQGWQKRLKESFRARWAAASPQGRALLTMELVGLPAQAGEGLPQHEALLLQAAIDCAQHLSLQARAAAADASDSRARLAAALQAIAQARLAAAQPHATNVVMLIGGRVVRCSALPPAESMPRGSGRAAWVLPRWRAAALPHAKRLRLKQLVGLARRCMDAGSVEGAATDLSPQCAERRCLERCLERCRSLQVGRHHNSLDGLPPRGDTLCGGEEAGLLQRSGLRWCRDDSTARAKPRLGSVWGGTRAGTRRETWEAWEHVGGGGEESASPVRSGSRAEAGDLTETDSEDSEASEDSGDQGSRASDEEDGNGGTQRRAAVGPLEQAREGEQWESGHALIGRRVRRAVLNSEGFAVAFVDGQIEGWLPAARSGYYGEEGDRVGRALWRVRYELEAVGVEDLEEAEVEAAVEAHAAAMRALESARGTGPRLPPGVEIQAEVGKTEEDAGLQGWWVSKSTWVGSRVRRDILDTAERKVDEGNATVVAWLPAALSNFLDERGRPAALWRVRYDDRAIGEEDLEAHEVEAAAARFLSWRRAYLEQRKARRSAPATQAAPAPAGGESVEAGEEADLAGWRTRGHELLGRTVARELEGGRGMMQARVEGWLPAGESNFRDASGRPAALWRVRFVQLEVGCEDLEEHEVRASLLTPAPPAPPPPAPAPAPAADVKMQEDGDDWRQTGSVLLGVRVRRVVPGAGVQDATVWGWLPAEESNFVKEASGLPAALWRIRFDRPEVGEEDLEEAEVHAAAALYKYATPDAAQNAPGSAAAASEKSLVRSRVRPLTVTSKTLAAEDKSRDASNGISAPALPSAASSDSATKSSGSLTAQQASASAALSGEAGSDSAATSQLQSRTETTSSGAAEAKVASAPGEADVMDDDEWRVEGSAYLRRWVVRFFPTPGDRSTGAAGIILPFGARVQGWLPREVSGFEDDAGVAQALWRLHFDNRDVGEEDVEEHELLVHWAAGLCAQYPAAMVAALDSVLGCVSIMDVGNGSKSGNGALPAGQDHRPRGLAPFLAVLRRHLSDAREAATSVEALSGKMAGTNQRSFVICQPFESLELALSEWLVCAALHAVRQASEASMVQDVQGPKVEISAEVLEHARVLLQMGFLGGNDLGAGKKWSQGSPGVRLLDIVFAAAGAQLRDAAGLQDAGIALAALRKSGVENPLGLPSGAGSSEKRATRVSEGSLAAPGGTPKRVRGASSKVTETEGTQQGSLPEPGLNTADLGPGARGARRQTSAETPPPAAVADAPLPAPAAAGAEGQGGGTELTAARAGGGEDGEEWRTSGNAWIGRAVRREVLDEAGQRVITTANATVVGWLPAADSNFVDDAGQPAALWHIRFSDARIGEEDLEEAEVQEALEHFERWRAQHKSNA